MSKSGEYNTVTLLYHSCRCNFNYLFTIPPKATLFHLQKHLFHFYCHHNYHLEESLSFLTHSSQRVLTLASLSIRMQLSHTNTKTRHFGQRI